MVPRDEMPRRAIKSFLRSSIKEAEVRLKLFQIRFDERERDARIRSRGGSASIEQKRLMSAMAAKNEFLRL
jgi:hypothetical protein